MILFWPVENGCVADDTSTLISGYSLPSSHLIVSLLPRVERVRNLKSEVTSWNTTSLYSGWMSAFMAAPGLLWTTAAFSPAAAGGRKPPQATPSAARTHRKSTRLHTSQ